MAVISLIIVLIVLACLVYTAFDKQKKAGISREKNKTQETYEKKEASPQPATNTGVEVEKVKWNFGEGFLFSKNKIKITADDIEDYKSGNLKKPYGSYHDCDVMVYTGGKYPRVVRIDKDIPTFDSDDREYDSWRDLYLVKRENGSIFAVYCTGGYRIAEIAGYETVYKFPDELSQYFDADLK